MQMRLRDLLQFVCDTFRVVYALHHVISVEPSGIVRAWLMQFQIQGEAVYCELLCLVEAIKPLMRYRKILNEPATVSPVVDGADLACRNSPSMSLSSPTAAAHWRGVTVLRWPARVKSDTHRWDLS